MIKKSDNDASKISTRIRDAVSIDIGITTAMATATDTMNEIPLPDSDDSTSGEDKAVTIIATQCYIAGSLSSCLAEMSTLSH